MANFLKFWAVVWTIGIGVGLFGSGLFGGGTATCYAGTGGLVDRFTQGFSAQVGQYPQRSVAEEGTTNVAAAIRRSAGLKTVAQLIGVVTGYFAGSSVHYALYAPACTAAQPRPAPQ
jgi:hypothetical protein